MVSFSICKTLDNAWHKILTPINILRRICNLIKIINHTSNFEHLLIEAIQKLSHNTHSQKPKKSVPFADDLLRGDARGGAGPSRFRIFSAIEQQAADIVTAVSASHRRRDRRNASVSVSASKRLSASVARRFSAPASFRPCIGAPLHFCLTKAPLRFCFTAPLRLCFTTSLHPAAALRSITTAVCSETEISSSSK